MSPELTSQHVFGLWENTRLPGAEMARTLNLHAVMLWISVLLDGTVTTHLLFTTHGFVGSKSAAMFPMMDHLFIWGLIDLLCKQESNEKSSAQWIHEPIPGLILCPCFMSKYGSKMQNFVVWRQWRFSSNGPFQVHCYFKRQIIYTGLKYKYTKITDLFYIFWSD